MTSYRHKLWGEIDNFPPSTIEEKDRPPMWTDKWRPSGTVTCNVPKVYNPPPPISSDDTSMDTSPQVSSSFDFPKNSLDGNVILHSIELRDYISEMKQLLISTQESTNSIENRENLTPPVPPTRYWPKGSRRRWDISDSQQPNSTLTLQPYLRIDTNTLFQLQRKAVSTIGLHVGYHNSMTFPLNCLSNVLGDYLRRLCTLLKMNIDSDQCEEGRGLEYVLDKTLLQFGINGKKGIHTYWNDILKDHERLMEDAEEQVEEFKRVMSNPKTEKDRLIRNLSLPLTSSSLRKKDSITGDLASTPWLPGTPHIGGEEQEISITGDIDMDNVSAAKTPDLGAVNSALMQQLSDQDATSLNMADSPPPPKRRLTSLSYGGGEGPHTHL